MLREDQTALLDGLPPHWRYALTGANDDVKRCFEEEWNVRGHGHPLETILRINSTPAPGEKWRSLKMRGVGVITGEESHGLLVVDFDGVGSQAARAFRSHFRQRLRSLPHTLCNISGKQGRAKLYFHVPPHWWPKLSGRSASWRSADGSVVLEAIWENSTGRGRHAVLCGDHPESSHQHPLYYRWAREHGPNEVQVAEAPEWLLLGILAQIEMSQGERTRDEIQRCGEDDAQPWERLTVTERRQLVELALPFCLNRQERGSGTYEKVRRIICGVLNEFGEDWALEILCDSEWDQRNEWGPGNDCAQTLKSLARSKVPEQRQARIATLFHFAREGGFVPPSWAMPPIDTAEYTISLKKLINQLYVHRGDSAAVALLYGRGRREFGIEPEVLRRLTLEQYLGTIERSRPKTLAQIQDGMRQDNIVTDVIDGVLGRRVHVLAGASHSGKTTLACFLANRVITGSPVDIDSVRHGVEKPGRVLVFTSDCSDLDMQRDMALEGLDASVAGSQLLVCSGQTFDDMLSICRQLEEFAPDLVIYDCLSSMACADVKIGDPAYADPIRLLVRHNGISWPKAAHLILHHTTRDEPTRFSGSEQIKAACEELWIYYPPELMKWRKGQARPEIGPTRHLVMEKSRSGYQGRALAVTRNAYQGTWQFHSPGTQHISPLERLSVAFRAVQHDEWRIASEWRRELDLEFRDRTLRRYLEQLDGIVLESALMRGNTGRRETHYRPRTAIRAAAKAMISSRGDGVNEV